MTKQPDSATRERIVPFPPLPPEIKAAIDRNNLVVFIGAGVSKIIGCKTWAELADQLLNECFSEGCINYKEKNRLLSENSLKKKISICQYILDRQKSDLFNEKVAKLLELDEKKAANFPIYQELYKLRAIYVTSNVDTNFDDMYFKDLIKYKPVDFSIDTLSKESLYHLHGTIRDNASMILTLRGYLDFYTNEKVKEFLNQLFSKFAVLFVGYGMDELEILEFLFEKMGAKKEKRHFILLPMYRGEENILSFEESYYSDLGINVIPYAIDEKGYDQLFFVIQNFEKEINLSTDFLYDSFLEIERNIAKYDEEIAKKLLQLIKNDLPLENHFFKKLTSVDWLIPLKNLGYFSPNKNPKPSPPDKDGFYSIPYWNVTDYLIKVSLQPIDSRMVNHSNDLMEIVRSIANYKEAGQRINNSTTDRALITIMANLSTTIVTTEDIDIIRYFFHSGWSVISVAAIIEEKLIPNLIKNKEKEKYLKLMDVVLSFNLQKRPPFGDEPTSILGDFAFGRLVEKNQVEMQSFLPLETAKIVTKKIEEIVEINSDFGIYRKGLFTEKVPEFLKNEFEYKITLLAKRLLFSALTNEVIETKLFLKKLLMKTHPFFKRLALSVIASSWEITSEIFSEWLSRQSITDYGLREEMRTIFQNHFDSFPIAVKDKILNWIDEGPEWERKEKDIEKFNRDIAYWKQDWVFILLPSGYQKAIDTYNNYRTITQREIKETHEDLTPAIIELNNRSPITVQELSKQNDEQLLSFLLNFKEQEGGWLAPNATGLAQTLSDVVALNPERFQINLEPFKNLPLIYQASLIQGFTKALKEDKKVASDKILAFSKDIIISSSIWDSKASERNQFISQLADLIISATSDDLRAFPEVDFQIMEEMLLFLLKKTEPPDLQYSDVHTSVLNSAKGQVISALVEYILHRARLSSKEKAYWSAPVRDEFTKRLDRKLEPSLEWSFCLGRYLPKLYFIDPEWVTRNIDNIFIKNNKEHWLAAFEGYLTANTHIELFNILKSHSHMRLAISTGLDKESREHLVNQIAIAYLRGQEELSDNTSLLRAILDTWETEDIINIIMFFWMLRDFVLDTKQGNTAEKQEFKSKILNFCQFINTQITEKNSLNTNGRVLSRLALLSCYVEEIDEKTLSWMLTATGFIDEYDRFFIEYLNRICDRSPHEVGLIFLRLSDSLASYGLEDEINSIISKLFKTEKGIAIQLCNKYFEKGLEFVRKTYEMNK